MSKAQSKPNSTIRTKRKPTKAAIAVKLLKRKSGASLEELMKTTGWQPHSVRGFLSGTVRKRMGLDLASNRDGNSGRRYFVTGEPVSAPARGSARESGGLS